MNLSITEISYKITLKYSKKIKTVIYLSMITMKLIKNKKIIMKLNL